MYKSNIYYINKHNIIVTLFAFNYLHKITLIQAGSHLHYKVVQ